MLAGIWLKILGQPEKKEYFPTHLGGGASDQLCGAELWLGYTTAAPTQSSRKMRLYLLLSAPFWLDKGSF